MRVVASVLPFQRSCSVAHMVCIPVALADSAQIAVFQPEFRCAMSSASRIDVLQEDKGLSVCLSTANIQPDWADAFIKQHGIETLEDYIYLAPRDQWEQHLTKLVDAVTSLRSKPVVLARFKAAFEAGTQALKQANTTPAKLTQDMLDEVLPETTLQNITRDFRAKYNLEPDAFLEPSDGLRSRVYREFRRGTMTVLEARRIKSILSQSNPKSQETVALAGGAKIEFDKDSPVQVSDAAAYYWSLRILAYAWAWAGLFKQRNPDGQERIFITLSQAMDYADFAFRACMEWGSGSLQWLQKNDTLCRGKSAGEALRECHIDWRSPAVQPTLNHGSVKRPAEPTSPPKEPSGQSAKRLREVKSDKWQTVSMVKGGKRICKRYNDARGCPGCSDLR